jgi:hypothetical protein
MVYSQKSVHPPDDMISEEKAPKVQYLSQRQGDHSQLMIRIPLEVLLPENVSKAQVAKDLWLIRWR